MGNELFDNIPSRVGELLNNIKLGRTGLPDLQRPFVWKDNKVRDLLDSMLKGFPIGYIMLWTSPEEYINANQIGRNDKTYQKPDDLVIDGQQRLTALLASIHGIKVKDKTYRERNIKISFNPLVREFAVWDQSYEKNPEWISEISAIFLADEEHRIPIFRRSYISSVNESREKKEIPLLTEDDEYLIESNITDLLNLSRYLLPTLKISSKAGEEEVADIFVRVNSGGQNLTEKNFIETLLAVYDNNVHDKINKFCYESTIPANGTSYNPILEVEPAHLIRMAVGLGFKRARLRYAYMLLRGKDLNTGKITEDVRNENLLTFKNSLEIVTNLNNWHAFVNLISASGYLKNSMIASNNAIVFSYILYLIGKFDYKVQPIELNKIIKKWFFMATITGFYTGSTESAVEKQFADLRDINSANDFVLYLDQTISQRFTEDYFKYTLINELNSSSATSPAWYGYIASVNVLGTPMLFSTTPLSYYFTIGSSGEKNSIDKHHIFPKHYLEKIGYQNDRDRNQIANFTYLDYNTNIDISDDAPSDYVPRYRSKLGDTEYKKACAQNALPDNFEILEYPEFLRQRRILMANIVKSAYKKLCE